MNTGLEIDTNARTETGNVIKNTELRPHSHPERSKLNCLGIFIFPCVCVCVRVCVIVRVKISMYFAAVRIMITEKS